MNMKKFFLFFLLAAALCASGVVLMAAKRTTVEKLSATMTTRTIPVGSFSKLEVSRVDVIFTPGPATGKVVLTAPDNIASHIEVKVSGNKLKIGLDDNTTYNHGTLNAVAKITAPSLSDIEATLSSKVTITADMNISGNFDLETSTSAQITVPFVTVTGECELDASTSSLISIKKLKVSGNTELDASTSAVINVGNLDTATADFDATTSGVIQVDKGSSGFTKFSASTSGVIKAAGFVASDATADASTSGSITANYKNLRKCTTSTGGSITRSDI